MLGLLIALLFKSCAVRNPYYEPEGIFFFFFQNCFLGGEKDLMVEVITEAFVQVPVLSDFCFVAWGVRGSVVLC